MATDVVIIEDEPLIALDLEQLVTDLGHRVVKIARTAEQAVDAVQRFRPGLVLADIHLADGSSGLDAVNEILRTFSLPVDLRHGLSAAAAHRHAARADVPHHEAVPSRQRQSRDQPGAVL